MYDNLVLVSVTDKLCLFILTQNPVIQYLTIPTKPTTLYKNCCK